MSTRRTTFARQLLSLGCASALGLAQCAAAAIPEVETRPRINLFPTSVVEDLSETSRAARQMENDMYAVVERLEKQKEAYQSSGCEGSQDPGCVQLRKGIRATYKEMLDVMQAGIPQMRESLDATADSMGSSLRAEIGRKMTPADVQRILGGRTVAREGLAAGVSGDRRQGKLSRMFSRYYELVRRGGTQSEALPVLASQIYLDSMQSLYFLDLIEAEIGSQSTELVLELEWGELTDRITTTVSDVKSLLWGDVEGGREILEVGLETGEAKDDYSDLLVR